MIRRAKLYARLFDPHNDNKYPRVPIEFNRNGRPSEPKLKPGQHVTSYLIRIGGKFIDTGTDFSIAVTRFHQERARLAGGVTRHEAAEVFIPSTQHEPTGRVYLADAIADYNAELQILSKGKYTRAMYKNDVDGFLQSCSKTFLDEIVRKDILNYIGWMKQNVKVRVKGRAERTYKNRLGYLRTFLSKHKIKLVKKHPDDSGLISRDDIPKPLKPKPKKYDRDSINLLLQHADEDQADYLLFLLWSGFRDEEVQYLLYSDFDWKNFTVTVHAKPKFNWRPKDSEERTVQLPSEISKRMQTRMKREARSNDDVVFPNGRGNPDSHLIYRLHAVAKKAGMNLKGKRAGHMFRKTAGSRVAKKFGLRAAMDFLGHSDIETTALYLAADELDAKKSRQAYDDMYEDDL